MLVSFPPRNVLRFLPSAFGLLDFGLEHLSGVVIRHSSFVFPHGSSLPYMNM